MTCLIYELFDLIALSGFGINKKKPRKNEVLISSGNWI